MQSATCQARAHAFQPRRIPLATPRWRIACARRAGNSCRLALIFSDVRLAAQEGAMKGAIAAEVLAGKPFAHRDRDRAEARGCAIAAQGEPALMAAQLQHRAA